MFSVANTSCTTADSYLELPNHCQTVLDLTCHHFAKRAVYHRLIDCFLAEFVLLNYTIHNYRKSVQLDAVNEMNFTIFLI